MHPIRCTLVNDRRLDGRRFAFAAPAIAVAAPTRTAADDIKLFAATFGAGFLFVTIFFA